MELFYPNIQWNLFRKISFRFFFLFTLLYTFSFSNFLLFFSIDKFYVSFINLLVPFFAGNFFSINYPIHFEYNYSSDTTVNYVHLFIYFCFATIGTLLWSIADNKRITYDTLFHYFLIFCRYYLAFQLIGYGWHKVFRLQMPDIGLNQLLMSVGDQTPMGLAWKFIGFSELFEKFTGWMEVISGILLFFRKTTLIGGLLSFIVMLNVMILNYSYDIPVKLYSGGFVLLSLIILSPYFKRLADVLFLQKGVDTLSIKPLFKKHYLNTGRAIFKTLLILSGVAGSFMQVYSQACEYGEDAAKPPLYGIYQTEVFIKNRDTMALYSDSTVWKRMVFNSPGSITVYKFSDKKYKGKISIDTLKQTVDIKLMNDSTNFYTLNYKQLNDTMYTFAGTDNKDTLQLNCRKINRTNFLLYKTGFNWINESANNR